jgi:hypothetical protein
MSLTWDSIHAVIIVTLLALALAVHRLGREVSSLQTQIDEVLKRMRRRDVPEP